MIGEEFNDWPNTAYKDYLADRKKVKLVAIKLRSQTNTWWEELRKSYQRMGQTSNYIMGEDERLFSFSHF